MSALDAQLVEATSNNKDAIVKKIELLLIKPAG
jgi:hypothetical protein